MVVQLDALIVGGGPAGLAAAVKLYENGIKNILIAERNPYLGGILNQCIHDGFGVNRFGEALTGPEYAEKFVDIVLKYGIKYMTNSTVLHISEKKEVVLVSPAGLEKFEAKTVILAMGCRERSRGALAIPGTRPAGIYTAGLAQRYMNIQNFKVGKEAVILGSGDIGLIMARRLSLEGVHVKAVFEIMPYANGLPRNVQQCLIDYGIPLYLNHTITDIKGKERLESVVVQKVDDNRIPVPGTETEFLCDTLILSVGLIPENELSRTAGIKVDPLTQGAYVDESYQTSVEGIFAAGNVLHVHDLVDFVSAEAENLADSVTQYIRNGSLCKCKLKINISENVSNVIPQYISGKCPVEITFRVKKPMHNATLYIVQNGSEIYRKTYKHLQPSIMEHIKFHCERLKIDEEDLEIMIKND